MKYDFTTRINRAGSGSRKWDAMYQVNPRVDSSVVPLSVADMEFKMPPELTEGLSAIFLPKVSCITVLSRESYASQFPPEQEGADTNRGQHR